MDGSSLAGEELRSRAFALSSGSINTVASAASSSSQVAAQDEVNAFITALRACTRSKDLYRGFQIHHDLLRKGLLEKCSDALVTMYAKCGELEEAKVLLETHNSRSLGTWTTIIAGYARAGRSEDALDCFDCMQRDGILPDAVTFASVLKACAAIGAADRGKEIHDEIVNQGLLEDNIVLGNALVGMYAKCGALPQAQHVLEELPSRDVVTWCALIAGYTQAGQGEQALNCFERMQRDGILPNAVTYICILKACTAMVATDRGEEFHDEIVRQGLLQKNIILGNALVDMYAKCGALLKARCVLEELPFRDVVSWNSVIAGYAQQGQGEQALDCFEHMQNDGVLPDSVTYACILKACATIRAVDMGKKLHDEVARNDMLDNNIILGTTLVDMYAKCGALLEAQDVLTELPSRDVMSWNALITGYAQGGQGEKALNCLEQMRRDGVLPDSFTYTCLLQACANTGEADRGKEIHEEIVKQGLLHDNIVLGNALLDMYAKCGALSNAQRAFEELPSRDVVAWSALIAGHTQEGQAEQALKCYEHMQRDGILPDAVTYACILKVYAIMGAVDKGKEIHDEISRQGLLENNHVLSTALVDMYAKCGALSKAQCVLEEITCRDVVSWNALIAGYVQKGQDERAFQCVEHMQRDGILPDAVTYVGILKLCALVGAAEKGKILHEEIVTQGLLHNNYMLGTALLDMYAKCGNLSKARCVLEELPSRNVVSWSALIAGYAQNGQAEDVLNCFKHMQNDGVLPDAVTIVCMLNMCSHLGLIEEGLSIFLNTSTKYGTEQDLDCYTCMIDLFGRAGHLENAWQLFGEMPSCDESAMWLAVMGACQKWGDVVLGRWAFEQALEVDKSEGPAHILMANICATMGT